MPKRTLVLSVITSLTLLLFYISSDHIGQPQPAFFLLSTSLFSFSIFSFVKQRLKNPGKTIYKPALLGTTRK